MTGCSSALLPVIALLLIVSVSWLATQLVLWWIDLYNKRVDRVAARRFAEKLGIEYLELLRKRDGGGEYQI